MKNYTFIVGITLSFILFITTGLLVWQKASAPQTPESIKIPQVPEVGTPRGKVSTPTVELIAPLPEGWKTYRNKEYGFEVGYPDGFKVEEHNEFKDFPNPNAKRIIVSFKSEYPETDEKFAWFFIEATTEGQRGMVDLLVNKEYPRGNINKKIWTGTKGAEMKYWFFAYGLAYNTSTNQKFIEDLFDKFLDTFKLKSIDVQPQ